MPVNRTIFDIISAIAALIRAEERKRCAELRLQFAHYEVLDYLSRSNQYTDTPAATAAFFGMTRGTVSQSLIVLEKKGYIEKYKDEADKRVIHVQLLPAGQAILKKAQRSLLLQKANKVLDQQLTQPLQETLFVSVLKALQLASQTQSFSVQSERFDHLKNATIFDLLELMAALIRAAERKHCTEHKLQLVHFNILDYLSLSNKYSDTPAAISNYLGMTRGTVSQSLMLLEERGYLRKLQDEKDKRVFHVQLLEKGHHILNKAKPTALFEKAAIILDKSSDMSQADDFVIVLNSLQKANEGYSFGVCKTCENFTQRENGYFCQLTQESLTTLDSEKICQEHVPL